MAARVLIVDDDAAYGRTLARSVSREGHEVTTCVNAAEARALFDVADPQVVILDFQLPDANGLALLDELRNRGTGAVFLINTAYPDLDVAVEAMRRGAFDYVAKAGAIRECLIRIERAVEVAQLRERVAQAEQADSKEDDALIGNSPEMRKMRHRLAAVADSDDTTVFIVGETGTGKGVVARMVHGRSGRSFHPFVAVDCTTIPATLVESELFGHSKGAFSGATQTKMGRVTAAARGTLFLDEIGELELPMQTKLLRLLEEREYTPVGSTKAHRLKARVVAATNRDLGRAVSEGRFRADLRYRLEVFVIEVPSLRDRGDDIFLLAKYFARDRARALGRDIPTLSDGVLQAMARYPFPGNVRELRNMVEQAVLLARGDDLTLEEFPVLNRVADGWELPARAQKTMRPPAVNPVLQEGEHRNFDYQTTLDGRPPSLGAQPIPPLPIPNFAATAGPAAATTEAKSLESIRKSHESQEAVRLTEALEQSGGNVSAAARALGLSRYQVLRRLTKYGLR